MKLLRSGGLFIILTAGMNLLANFARAEDIYGNLVPIKVWSETQIGGNYGGSGGITIYGSFSSGAPGAEPGPMVRSSSAPPHVVSQWTASLDFGTVKIIPFQTYSLDVVTQYLLGGKISVAAPEGYQVSLIMDSMNYGNTVVYSNPDQELTKQFRVELMIVPDIRKREPLGAVGSCSSLVPGKIEWRVSMGNSYDGETAGELVVYHSGDGDKWWLDHFLPQWSVRGAEMTLNGTTQGSGGFTTPEAVLTLANADYVAAKYEILLYTHSQMPLPGQTAMQGEPFVKYILQRGSTDTSLLITQETRNIASATATGHTVKRRQTSLVRSGTAPAYRWEVVDWHDEGTDGVRHIVQGGGTESARTLSYESKYTGGTAALAAHDSFTMFSWGEALTQKQLGSTDVSTTTYEYYQDANDPSQFGRLKSQIGTNGNWASYTYCFSAAGDSRFDAGVVSEVFRPWKNAPATPTQDSAQGEYVRFVNSYDASGRLSRPCIIEKKIEGKLASRTHITYLPDGTVGPYNLPVVKATRNEYTGTGETLVTVTRFFSESYHDFVYAQKPHSVTNPDGTKSSYIYQYGTWNGTTFTPASNGGFGGLNPPKGSRLSVIHGVSSAQPNFTTYDGYDIDDLSLVDGKSTLESTIRDDRAKKVREETYLWSSGSWHLIGFKTYTYNFVGQLTGESDNSGSGMTYTYDGLRLISQTDNTGAVTTYAYDNHGRVLTNVEAAAGPLAALTTQFEYDATGKVTKEKKGWGGSELLTTQNTFDDSGRLRTETSPGVSATTHTYSVASRTHTTTRPDGSTVIETNNRDGSLASVTGTGTLAKFYSDTVSANGNIVTTERIGSTTSPRWKEVTKDWAGRVLMTRTSAFEGASVTEQNFYRSSAEAGAGQLYKKQRTDAPTLRYEYDQMGEMVRSGMDFEGNGLTLASSDRITDNDSFFEQVAGAWWKVDESWTYPAADSASRVRLSSSRVRLTGFPAGCIAEMRTTDSEDNVMTQTTQVNPATKSATRTTTRTGYNQNETETFVRGLTTTKVSHDGIATDYIYDALHRLSQTLDGRDNATTITYHSGSTLESTVSDALNQSVSTKGYDTSGRLAWSGDALNNYTYFAYTARGELWRQWGGGAMPVEYVYDTSYGDRTALKTYRSGNSWANVIWPGGTADTTTWTYDASAGLLISKSDAADKSTIYRYNLRGQPTSVTQMKTAGVSVVKNYSYFEATGELKDISYNDGTPGVSYYRGTAGSLTSYTRLGRVSGITDATGERQFIYSETKPWRLDAEVLGSAWSNRVITWQYEATGVVGRNAGFSVGTASQPTADVGLTRTFAQSGLLSTITSASGAGTVAYGYTYEPNTRLVSEVSASGGTFRWLKSYEPKRNVLTSIEFKASTVTQAKFSYGTNARGQREWVKQSGPVFQDFGSSVFQRFVYNSRGALTSAASYAGEDPAQPSAAIALPGRFFEFEHDHAGNRRSANNTGVAGMANDYTSSATNAYLSRENNALSVSGTAVAFANVLVDFASQLAARQGRFWADEIIVPNTTAPWRGNVKVTAATNGSAYSETRIAQLPPALQSFNYDYRGNLSTDQIWDYTWDGENRLIRLETTTAARTAGHPHRILDFRYDYMGRRVEKRVREGGTMAEISWTRFIYEGWDLVAEYNATASALGALQRSYAWGLDGTGGLTLTGGAGALLQITDHPSGKRFLPAYDGNGNVAALFNYSNGNVAAAYEYTPFGEPLRQEVLDTTIVNQPYRYSTKFLDVETGLHNYGRRFYSSSLGRFVSRDPIEEAGGINLYDFCGGDPINKVDVLGEQEIVDAPPSAPFEVTASRWGSYGPMRLTIGGYGITGTVMFYNNVWPFPGEFTMPYKPYFGVQTFGSGPDPKHPSLGFTAQLGAHIKQQIAERRLTAGQKIKVPIILKDGRTIWAVTTVPPNNGAPNSSGIDPANIRSKDDIKNNPRYRSIILPTDEALALIARGYPVKHTAVVHNNSGRELLTVDEQEALRISKLPSGQSALGVDGFVDPVFFKESGGRFKYYKLTRGTEATYEGASLIGPAWLGIMQSGVSFFDRRNYHAYSYIETYLPPVADLFPRQAGGWKDHFTWWETEGKLKNDGVIP